MPYPNSSRADSGVRLDKSPALAAVAFVALRCKNPLTDT